MVNDKPIWVVSGKRDILLDLVTASPKWDGRVRPAKNSSDVVPREGDLTLVWQEYPHGSPALPNCILGHRATLDETFAWAATYLRVLGPLSAICRVVLTHDADLLFEAYRTPTLTKLEGALVGLILTEVLTLARHPIRVEDITVPACQSTLAYSFARALALGRNLEAATKLPELWERTRRLTGAIHSSELDIQSSATACLTLTRVLGGNQFPMLSKGTDFVADCLRDLDSDGQLTLKGISRLVDWLSESPADQLTSILDLSPQDRVRVFDSVAPRIAASTKGTQLERAFATAMVASLCKPGSLQQYNILREHRATAPEGLLWFGLIQGLHRPSDVLNIADGLGRRVIRDALQPERVLDRPRSDISLIELEVLSRGKTSSFRTAVANQICVEIQPAIYSLAKWRGLGSPVQSELIPEPGDETRSSRDPFDELSATLRYATNLVQVLRRGVRSTGQQDLKKNKRRPD